MEKTRQIILNHERDFPFFAEYYIQIINKIEENIQLMPDIAIEGCKALIEGVSKGILKYQGKPYESTSRTNGTPQRFLKEALQSLYGKVDEEFVQSTANFVIRIGQLRNDRGDISHGKAAPKDESSDKYLAEVIARTTDGLVCYLLTIFFTTDWSYLEEIKYDKNEEFNQYLDEGMELDGVLYSKALFDQDPVAYKQQLENYQDAN